MFELQRTRFLRFLAVFSFIELIHSQYGILNDIGESHQNPNQHTRPEPDFILRGRT